MYVFTNVTNRFAYTLFMSRIKNYDNQARETTFMVVLPKTAYISGFVLEVAGKKYEAYLTEKDEAKHIYEQVPIYVKSILVYCMYSIIIGRLARLTDPEVTGSNRTRPPAG